MMFLDGTPKRIQLWILRALPNCGPKILFTPHPIPIGLEALHDNLNARNHILQEVMLREVRNDDLRRRQSLRIGLTLQFSQLCDGGVSPSSRLRIKTLFRDIQLNENKPLQVCWLMKRVAHQPRELETRIETFRL